MYGKQIHLADTAVVFYRIKRVSVNLGRDKLYSLKCLRELAFLSPSLENYCVVFPKQQQNLALSFPSFA